MHCYPAELAETETAKSWSTNLLKISRHKRTEKMLASLSTR